MKQISPYTPLANIVAAEANTDSPPETFSRIFLEASTVLASYGDSNRQKHEVLCAFALRSLPAEEREAFMSEYEVPSSVWQMVTASKAPEWPVDISTSTDVSE